VTTWEEASKLCDEILRMIEEDVSEKARDKAADFFESIVEKVKDIQGWIDENEHVTPKMLASLEGMQSGVAKWIRD